MQEQPTIATSKPLSTHGKQPLVLHIAPTPFFSDRGCHIRIEGIANSLERLGYNNVVCTYHHGRDVAGIETARISPIKNYTQTAAGPSKYKPWADLKLLFIVIKEIRKHRPTVLHAHLHEGLAIALAAKTILFWKRIPLVADIQGSLSGELKAHGFFAKTPWLLWPFKLLERLLIALAKTVICSSEQSFQMLKNDFKLDQHKLSLVQDGANPAPSISDAQTVALREKYAIPDNKLLLVYSGALLDSKGLKHLKELISHCNTDVKVHFLIIGYPVENVEPYLAEHDLIKLCTITGQVPFEELPALLSLADIAIDPKANDAGEGSGKILNYLACSLPVLAFNTRNNTKFLPAGTTLFNSSNEMKEQIERWSQTPTAMDAVASRNLDHFKRHYSWDNTASQLRDVYADQHLNLSE